MPTNFEDWLSQKQKKVIFKLILFFLLIQRYFFVDVGFYSMLQMQKFALVVVVECRKKLKKLQNLQMGGPGLILTGYIFQKNYANKAFIQYFFIGKNDPKL